MSPHRNVTIIGSGPAGLTAALYAARANLKPLVIEGLEAGGQLMLTTSVENFPGFRDGVMGPDLIADMRAQAVRFGAEIIQGNVTKVEVGRCPIKIEVGNDLRYTESLINATGVVLRDTLTGKKSELPVDGVFVAIGHTPNTSLFVGQLEMDANGYLITHQGTRTSVPGVFACGDVQDHIYRQAITAAGTGCMAAIDAEHYLDHIPEDVNAELTEDA